ncbi:MAG: cytochrome c [Archangium sp.]|nr:cytochrome c [Archangium sp.]
MTRTTRWSLGFLVAATLIAPNVQADDPKPDKKIERLWKSKCSSCHGQDGKGQTEKGKKMKVADYTTAEWQKAKTDEVIKKAIADGFKGEKDGVKQEMDGYKADLTPEQIDGLVVFTRSLGAK